VRLRWVSFSAETVTLNVITPPPAGYYLVFVLLGGSDFAALVDNFTTNVNVGTPLDRTGLGVPAEAAILCVPRVNIGIQTGAAGFSTGFWAASPHSGMAAISGDLRNGQNPPAVEQEARDDRNALGITGASQMGATLSQIPTGYRVTAVGTTLTNQKSVVAMSFGGKRVAWAGFLQTPTALGSYSWRAPHLRPDLVISALTRRANLNAGDGAGADDSSVQGFGIWTSGAESALAISQQDAVSPTVAKMHVAGRFLSVPRSDGQLTGNPTTPDAADAILASAVEAAEGLDLTFTRTSATPRFLPTLVIGDEQTIVPAAVALGLAGPAANLLQFQNPAPSLVPLAAPDPFVGFIRPAPAGLGLLAPAVALDLPLPAMPGVEPTPPPPLGDFYGRALLDLVPRGLGWARGSAP
jgi:hypothetical protein